MLAIVALPPPTHGQAVVNQRVVKSVLALCPDSKVVNTSPGSLARNLGYHLRRLKLFIFDVVPAILRMKSGTIYHVIEPGLGMTYNFLVISLSRLVGLRMILHHHSALYTRAFNLRFSLLSRIAGVKAIHVALDEQMAQDLRAQYPFVQTVIVLHNASHIDRPELIEPSLRTLTCGFMSNLTREKGLDIFLDCLRSIRQSGTTVQAVLAGPPASADAARLVVGAETEFGSLLTFMGQVEGTSKDAFFRSIDVFLFPTRYKLEAQPLVVLEALSYGVPVVVSDQGYCAELVGPAGVRAPIHEFEEKAVSFIKQCCRDPAYLEQMRTEARSRYECLKAEGDLQLQQLLRECLAQ